MSEGAYFANDWGLNLTNAEPSDEYRHGKLCSERADPTCTETQYLGFTIPRERIYGISYVRHHPNLGHMLGGALVFKGIRHKFLAAELCDMRLFLPDTPALESDYKEISLVNSYTSRIIAPLQELQTTYNDPDRDNRFDMRFQAIAPAVALEQTGHFEQLMRATGTLVLRGTPYEVDCLTVRNRTWGELRDEKPPKIPATGWISCFVGEDLAIFVNAIDDPQRNPVWKGKLPYELSPRVLLGGWIWKQCRIVTIKSASKHTVYDERTWAPVAFSIELVDGDGDAYSVQGKITASCPFNVYLNVATFVCLGEIVVNGVPGYCDFQEIQWTDFLHAMAQ